MKITNPILPKQENQSNYHYFLQFTQELNRISCVNLIIHATKLNKLFEKRVDSIKLCEKWLREPSSVTQKELYDAGWLASVVTYTDDRAASDVSWLIAHVVDVTTNKRLLNYLGYLLPKEPILNNFNIDLLKQNPQAYSFLETISKLEDHQVTNDDLFGIRQVFDVLEEVGAPLDPNEFQWDGETTEKHKLLQAIRREFL